jgi:putative phosphoesterase
MRLGIISDAHGNAQALERCLAHLRRQRAERVLFLGDAVGYLPDAARCAALLDQAGALCLQGNHEAMLTGDLPISEEAEEVIGLRRFIDGLSNAWLDTVRRTGSKVILDVAGRRLVLVHGSPVSPLVGRVHAPGDIGDLSGQPDIADADAILMGHTHRPFIFRKHGRLFLNPGSCGLPRDQGDLPSMALLDLETMEASVHRLRLATPCDRAGVHPRVKACLERRCDAPYGEILSREEP